jgi:hypothetical protein
MKRSQYHILSVLFLLIISAAGCRSTKKISTVIQTPKDTVAFDAAKAYADSVQRVKTAYDRLLKNHVDYVYFSSKVNIEYDDAKGEHYDFNAFVRMYNDSVIWMSIIAALGIEGFRVKITPDSVFVLDKIAKTYQARSLDYIRDVAQIPFDFKTLQNLIVGNNIYTDSTVTYFDDAGANIMLQTTGPIFVHLFTMSKTENKILNNKIDDMHEVPTRTLSIANLSFENVNGFNFPSERRITITDKKMSTLALKYKQIDFNQKLNFPFSVPRNYKRK